MKTLGKTISLILVALIIFMSTSTAAINTFASSNINASSSAKNVAVLLYSFDDLFMLELKKHLPKIYF